MSTPNFSVGEYTTPKLSFLEDLEVYRAAGVDGIGIDVGLKPHGPGALERLRESGLKATFCFPATPSVLPLPWMAGTNDPAARVEEACRSIYDMVAYDPVSIVCATGPQGTYGEAEARKLVVDGLRRIARTAAEVNLTVAVEALHKSIRDDFTIVTEIPDTIALIDEINEPNVGMMFDIWHLWDTPNLLDHIREHATRFMGVQVNDWRDPTRSWCDRVLPGDGLADSRGILAALDDAGYKGWYELEVFSDDGTYGNEFPDSLWKLDPVEMLASGRQKFLDLWNSRHDAA